MPLLVPLLLVVLVLLLVLVVVARGLERGKFGDTSVAYVLCIMFYTRVAK